MKIDEVKQRRQHLQEAITKLVWEFEQETHCRVESIEIPDNSLAKMVMVDGQTIAYQSAPANVRVVLP